MQPIADYCCDPRFVTEPPSAQASLVRASADSGHHTVQEDAASVMRVDQ